MNIFYTDPCPVISAQNLCDKHIVKMPLESAQMLSTAWRLQTDHSLVYDPDWNDKRGIYQKAYEHHPSTKWASRSAKNYKWLFHHFVSLCIEYQYRYNKIHASFGLLEALSSIPHLLRSHHCLDQTFTEPPMCMPDEYKADKNTITAYRNYIHGEKKSFAVWAHRPAPAWFVERG